MRPTLSLSWKHKFWLLIAATLVGLVLVTLSALRGLDQVSGSYEARADANTYETASLTLWGEWLKVEGRSPGLQPSGVDEYERLLNSLNTQADELLALGSSLGDADIAETASTIETRIAEYVAMRTEWLEQRSRLGLSGTQGIRGELNTAMNEGLREISISVLNDDIEMAMAAYSDYLSSFNQESAATTYQAIEGMEGVISDMGWEDNDLGQSVQAFSAAFARADALAQTIVGMEQQLADLGKDLEAVIEAQNASLRSGLVARTSAQADAARSESAWLTIIVSAIVLIVLVVTLTQASHTLVGRLNDAVKLLTRVAGGDLSGRLSPGRNSKDEFNALGTASNQMMDDVSDVIRQVIDGNKDLSRLQGELQQLMQQMSANSEKVEAQTEQTAAAVQEISHTAVEIVSLTTTVNQSAQEANSAAQSGAQVIKNSVGSMHELSGKIQQTHQQVEQLSHTGEKVNSIVDTINGLAEQTNLLALNAAIEAARAGEAGRGFSVVADEVRSLAEKTVAATRGIADIVSSLNSETREISILMQQGLEKASDGEKSAEEAASVIDRITRSIDSLAGDMDQVVSSVEGISATTEEIAQKVEQIHVHTLETRSIREQLENHTYQLSNQAESLNETSGRFRVS